MTGELMEFCITSDLQEVRRQVITTNYPTVKKWAESVVEQYENIVVTPDTISAAKADRARLRKAQSGVSDVRKEMRAAALSTCAAEESNCKDLEAVFERGVQALDVQIKAMENAVKEEKRLRLMDYFAKVVGDMAEWISFDDCFNPKWLNTTYAESTAQADMCAAIDQCRADLNAIRALGSEFETELLAEYRTSRNIGTVLMKNSTLTRLKAEENERKRREAEAAAASQKEKEQRFKMYAMPPEMCGQQAEVGSINELVDEDGQELAEAPSVADAIRATEREAFEHAVKEAPPVCTVDFRVYGTAAQLDGLKAYMEANGIRYGRVPQE